MDLLILFGGIYILLCIITTLVILLFEWKDIYEKLKDVNRIYIIRDLLIFIFSIPFIPILAVVKFMVEEYDD